MFARSQQISSPLLLPMIGSIITTSLIVSLLAMPPSEPILTLRALLLRTAVDLAIAAFVHTITVCLIWRLIRDYAEPSLGTLALHIWAAAVWLPLITTLNAERSVWISCLVPWACANAITFLNLWSELPYEDEGTTCPPQFFLQPQPVSPLWRTLLPLCVTMVVIQAGLVSLASGHPWSAAALISAGVILFLVHRPLVIGTGKNRRTFSGFSMLQTAIVFFLISTALTPYLQKAYGLSSMSALLAVRPSLPKPTLRTGPSLDYSGIILKLPPKPHAKVEPPNLSNKSDFSAALSRPVVIPFDGAYWYFKQSDTRPKPDALVEQGDPLKVNVHSTDHRELAMEAHQALTNVVSADCCGAVRIELLNGDNRIGAIQIILILTDKSAKPSTSILMGSIPLPSSQSRHIALDRSPVAESLLFKMPAKAHGKRFDEITVVIAPSSERALAGSKIAIQNFILLPNL